jgi:perosamine synthetase
MPENNPSKYLGNEFEYLQRVLRSESWASTSGSWVHNLEASFAAYAGTEYAVAMNSGTSTLHAALMAVGVKPDDEVISPALTVIMDTTATLHAGAVPVYADVDAATFNIDPQSVERAITPRTRAVIAVSLYGLPPDLPALRTICDTHGIPLIEDNAQCVGGSIGDAPIGSFGVVSSWSLENTKHLSAGEGGMLTTDSEELATLMRKFGGHGFRNLTATEGRVRLRDDVFQSPDYERHDELGWNYRMPEFIAAVALAQLERVDEFIRLRQLAAARLIDAMAEAPYLTPQRAPEGYVNSYYTLGVAFDEDLAGTTWKEFRRIFVDEGGEGFYGCWAVPYLEPLMRNRAYLARMPDGFPAREYPRGLCPVAEALQPRLMQFKTNYRDADVLERQAEALHRATLKVGGA